LGLLLLFGIDFDAAGVVSIHFAGRKDHARTRLMRELIGDLAVIHALRESIKSSHAAHKAFIVAFEIAWKHSEVHCRNAIAATESVFRAPLADRPRIEADATRAFQGFREQWQEQLGHPLLADAIGRLRSSRKDSRRFKILRCLMSARMPDTRYVHLQNSLLENGHRLLDCLEKTFHALEMLESSADDRNSVSKIPTLARDLMICSSQAASTCDDLLRCTVAFDSVLADSLRDIYPDAPFRHENLHVGDSQ